MVNAGSAALRRSLHDNGRLLRDGPTSTALMSDLWMPAAVGNHRVMYERSEQNHAVHAEHQLDRAGRGSLHPREPGQYGRVDQ